MITKPGQVEAPAPTLPPHVLPLSAPLAASNNRYHWLFVKVYHGMDPGMRLVSQLAHLIIYLNKKGA